ncbi:NAD(P)-dependent oxidoreductase [Lentibacter algarum]|uniref:NAD-dependent epimerase/dehydratase family protein n=1 Tax=Lentibacter algarum TaxID=576131 RepID=UPI001C0759B9|nr:NAD(P)-dependent oxidoreductase [Lentibacter algarum]MBU2980204.1 NAD(P)-dependent oxidoreductase [Lentibacter algarum]
MSFKKILVTGAAGLLGQHAVRQLQEQYDVSGFDLKAGTAAIDWHLGDLADADSLKEAVAGQDAIVQIAAIPNIWSGTGAQTMQVNVVGLYNLLNAAEEAGVKRVVICSSDSVVGFTVAEGAMVPPQYLPIDLDHPLNATDPYALSKVLGEEMGRSFAARGKLEVLVMRPVFVAYPEMHDEIRARALAPENYKGPSVGGPSSAGGGPCWHHIDPRDLARAFQLGLEMEYRGFDRFFLSANVTLSPEPTLERLANWLGYVPEIRDPAVYDDTPHAPLYDLRHARDVLGFEAAYDARKTAIF